MNSDAADALINNLVAQLTLIGNIHNKITALEETLKEQKPELFKIYRQKEDEVAQNPRVSFNLIGIENLRKLLMKT
ncbi:MAG TPA: hypothetical protein VFF95_04015 [Candidatus Binatus sp.]|jgi:hypothetical protein|nr:hypothetical protein [Candidatus Binatus sp.]